MGPCGDLFDNKQPNVCCIALTKRNELSCPRFTPELSVSHTENAQLSSRSRKSSTSHATIHAWL